MSQKNPVIDCSTIRWINNTPVNIEYDDSYYSDEDGPEESSYVFLGGNRIPARWNDFEQSQLHQFSIIETGFGSGLNFFNVASAWKDFRALKRPVHLRKLVYTSIEGFPLRREDLSQIISSWPAGFALTSELLDVYPLPVKGIYSFQFGSIELNLIFMPLDQALAEFEPKGKVLFDAMFLDGFAPAKNETMWHPVSLRRLSFLCKQGATFSTFTAATKVRLCLAHCGFSITRQKGFGRKREMLTGIMERRKYFPYRSKTPWYYYPGENTKVSAPVVIVGGGVAGCATACALARQGIKSIIIEQAADVGGTAGALNRCLYSHLLSADFNIASQFYWHAYHHLQQYLQANPEIRRQQTGVFYIADNESRIKHLSSAYEMLKSFGKDFIWLTENQTQDHAGISISFPGLFAKYGGWLDGQQFCKHLSDHEHVQRLTNTSVTALTQQHDGWLIHTGTETVKSKHVIICTGWAYRLIEKYHLCRLETIKGQTTTIHVSTNEKPIKTILNNGHYVIPGAYNSSELIVGASFEKAHRHTLEPGINADIENLTAIRHINPGLSRCIEAQVKVIGNRKTSGSDCGLRLTTRDHLPLIGPVPDLQFYADNYSRVIQSGRLKDCPGPEYYPGLFVNTAHGSRGVTASILSGNLICSMITGGGYPLPGSLYQAVHPARFYVRDQLRKKTEI